MHATSPRNVMPRFSIAALVAIAAVTFSGCSLGTEQAAQTFETEPANVVSVLPSRPGLTPVGPPTPLDAAAFTIALIGRPDPNLTSTLVDGGFRRGTSRTWTGANGASLTAVVGLWRDGDPAQSIGGDAADVVVGPGTVWMPTEFRGSQGKRGTNARALNVVTGQVSLFLRASGPVDDAAVLRQMYLMFTAATGRDGPSGAPNG